MNHTAAMNDLAQAMQRMRLLYEHGPIVTTSESRPTSHSQEHRFLEIA